MIIFPALVYALEELSIDGASERYQDRLWYRVISNAYQQVGKSLERELADRSKSRYSWPRNSWNCRSPRHLPNFMNFAMEVMQIEIVHYEERYVNGTEATAPECLYVVLYGKKMVPG